MHRAESAGTGRELASKGVRAGVDTHATSARNPRVIVVNGFRRGGTSIVWNILESHPQVCSPLRETGEIIYEDVLPWLPELPTKLILRTVLRNRALMRLPLGAYFDEVIQNSLWTRKLGNFSDPDNRHKFDGVAYTAREVDEAVLCLKSVNWDTYLTEYFATYYPDTTFIGLMRNGYALCNGMIRRGDAAEKAGKVYRRIGERMIADQKKYPRYKLIRFEDVLKDPFAMATELYEFSRLNPARLDALRLKSKRVLSQRGEHETRFGEEDHKYWFDRDQIWAILDEQVNETQASFLSKEDRLTFERHAQPVLDYFQYS